MMNSLVPNKNPFEMVGFLQVFSVIILLVITSIVSGLCRSNFYNFDKSLSYEIDGSVDRHVQEIIGVSSVHIMIDAQASPELTNRLLSKYTTSRPTYLTATNHSPPPTPTRIRNLVAIFNSIQDINLPVLRDLYNSTWDSRSKIVIWLTHPPDNNSLTSLFQDLWSLGSANVVIFTANLSAYSFDPFHVNPRKGSRGKLSRLLPADLLFPDKFRNLQGHPIRISMYNDADSEPVKRIEEDDETPDTMFLIFLASFLNFTMEVVSAPKSLAAYQALRFEDSGYPVGVAYDLVTNRSDILGNFQFLQRAFNQDIEFIKPLLRSRAQVTIPRPRMLPDVIRTFRSLDKHTLTLLMVLSLKLMLYMYVKKQPGPFINTIRLFVQQQFWKVSQATSEKMMAISWIFFAYIFMGMQQTQLVKDMASPPFPKRIHTLEQLADSNLTIITDPYIYSTLNNSHDPIKRRIADITQIQRNYLVCLHKMGRGERVACARDSQIIINKEQEWKKNQKVYVMQSAIGEYWRVMLVRKNFPYIDKFNECFARIHQAGLIEHFLPRGTCRRPADNQWEELFDTRRLNLKHFNGCLILCSFCFSLSFIVFIGELVISKFISKINNCRFF